MVYNKSSSPTSTYTSLPSDDQSTVIGLDDVPPSYEAVAGPSSSTATVAAVATATAPVAPHLFSTPPTAEPLLGRTSTILNDLRHIETTNNGLSTHDPCVANDPHLMYDFIRSLVHKVPQGYVTCRGIHRVVAERSEHIVVDNVPRDVKAGETYYVTDFNFQIPLIELYNYPDTLANVHLYTVQDDRPARRGKPRTTFGGPDTPQRVWSADEKDLWLSKWGTFWRSHGLPAWYDMRACAPFMATVQQHPALRGGLRGGEEEALVGGAPAEPALRAWCEAFCRDAGLLKRFQVRRDLWGWEWSGLHNALVNVIKSTGYNGVITVEHVVQDQHAVVHADTWLSRAVNTRWIYVLLVITLIYPFIYIFQRVHPRGGMPYDVTRISYAMKCYPPLPDTFPAESVEAAQARLPSLYKTHPELPREPFLQRGPRGVHYLLGKREGEWLREWEDRVRMGVRMNFKGVLEDPARVQVERPQLDGY